MRVCCKGRLPGFFVTPDLERIGAAARLQVFGHGAGANPTPLFVEPGRTVVTDRAGEPRRAGAAGAQAGLGIDNQGCGNARPPRGRRDVELMELPAFRHAEADGVARRTDDTDLVQGGRESLLEAREGPQTGEIRGQDLCMRILPALEPDLCQRIELRCAGIADHHGDETIAQWRPGGRRDAADQPPHPSTAELAANM